MHELREFLIFAYRILPAFCKSIAETSKDLFVSADNLEELSEYAINCYTNVRRNFYEWTKRKCFWLHQIGKFNAMVKQIDTTCISSVEM